MENGAARVKAGCGAKGGKAIARLMSGKDQERERRLAEALRENLRKRKAQARALSGGRVQDEGKDEGHRD